MFTGDMKVYDLPYIDANKDALGKDWAEKGDYKKEREKYKIINLEVLENDKELNMYLTRAREAVNKINTGNGGEKYDYDICITDKCYGGNSNTVQKLIYENMGIKMKVPDNIDMPGINGEFYVGPTENWKEKSGKLINEYVE
ncbi:MAG: hypothetical protein EOP34_11295, partial [Rickettsiales bacterium]